MGSRVVNFSFTPGENEQIETVIKLPEEHRSIIHGIVKNHCNKVVKDAVVKLFECVEHNNEQSLKPLTHTFTDECGQFLFGPLSACKNYVIKIWVNDVKIRELIVCPEDLDCDGEDHHCKKHPDGCDKHKDCKEEPKEHDERPKDHEKKHKDHGENVVQTYYVEDTLDELDE